MKIIWERRKLVQLLEKALLGLGQGAGGLSDIDKIINLEARLMGMTADRDYWKERYHAK